MKILDIIDKKSVPHLKLIKGVKTNKALKKMLRYRAIQAPVVEGKKLIGLIDRGTLVEYTLEYPASNQFWVARPVTQILIATLNDEVCSVAKLIPPDQMVIPVLENGEYVNSLTRAEIFRAALDESENAVKHYECYITSFGATS